MEETEKKEKSNYLNLPHCKVSYIFRGSEQFRVPRKTQTSYGLTQSTYVLLISFDPIILLLAQTKGALQSMLHHQYLHQFRDLYFKMHFCVPNMTLPIM